MNKLTAIFLCFLALGLSACSSGSDTDKKTVFDGYAKDVEKAKQVQKKVDAAHARLKKRIEKAETGKSDESSP